jgi:bacillithiol biosynthesis deacetylase BshB1
MSAPEVQLVVFAAHPDDAELCCGGLLALSAAQGHRTAVVDLSRGELSSRGTPELRRREAEAAAVALGLTARENLELPDGWLWSASFGGATSSANSLPSAEPLAIVRAAAAIRRLRPELLVIPHPTERHPDHEAAGHLLTRAAFLAGLSRFVTPDGEPPHSPARILRYPFRVHVEPSVVVDITSVIERKRAAVACFASQTAGDAAAPNTLLSESQAIGLGEIRDRFFGAMIGVAYGEPYVLESPVALTDPITQLRAQGGGRAHLFPSRRT